MQIRNVISLFNLLRVLSNEGWKLDACDSHKYTFKGQGKRSIFLNRHPWIPDTVYMDEVMLQVKNLNRELVFWAYPEPQKTAVADIQSLGLSSEAVLDKLRQHDKLPSSKTTALEIFRLTSVQKDGRHEQLVDIVKMDPALAKELIHHVNSPFYGRLKPVQTVKEAIDYIGPRKLRQFVLGVITISQLRRGRCRIFDYGRFWSQVIAQAFAAEQIVTTSPSLHHLGGDVAFTAGLLGQIGKLAYATVFPDDYTRVLSCALSPSSPQLGKIEEKQFGLTHQQVTEVLLTDCRLPTYFCRAAAYHDTPDNGQMLPPDSPERELAVVLFWSHVMADIILRQGHNQIEQRLDRMYQMAHRWGHETESFGHCFNNIISGWSDMAEVFHLPAYPVPSWDEIYAKAS